MRIWRSSRCGVSIPVLFWTSACLLLLTGGVSSASLDKRFTRPRYGQDGDAQMQERQNVLQFLKELLQRHQQRANLQLSNNGEDLSDRDIDWRRLPAPLLQKIKALISEGSKEEEKRGSYMSLCHFKICNLGKKK